MEFIYFIFVDMRSFVRPFGKLDALGNGTSAYERS